MIMKNTKSICILLGIIATAVITAAVVLVPPQTQEQEQPKAAVILTEEEGTLPEEPVRQTNAFDGNVKYVIMKDGDYLTVYQKDYQTVYAYTDILYRALSDELKEKVSQGLTFEDEKALYDFLENYSS